jgi:hypothetical protein
VEGDDFTLFPGEDIAISCPAGAPLAVISHIKAVFLQAFIKLSDLGAGVPDDPSSLGEYGEKFLGFFKLFFICPSHSNHYLIEVRDIFDIVDNLFYGRSLQL